MGRCQFHQFFMILVVFLSLLAGFSASASISDGIFSGDSLTGRSLLQAKKRAYLMKAVLCAVVKCLLDIRYVTGSNPRLRILGSSQILLMREPCALGCPVNFEFQNYTIITSQCKGPQYPPKLCCSAFKEFACPFAENLNDLTNDCATTMFSYINLNGKYPPGLFASVCREGKEGLECPAPPPSESENVNGSPFTSKPSLLHILAAIFLILSLLL